MGVTDHWLPLPISCFRLHGKPSSNTAEEAALTCKIGSSRACACLDDDDESLANAEMPTNSRKFPSSLQQCRSFANVGNEACREQSREHSREIFVQLEPSQLMEESPSGRVPCVCFVHSSIDRLKKEWGSRKGSGNGEGRPSLQTIFPGGHSSSTEELGRPGLPDDVVELCLARMSFSTLARARMVCRKWRDLTMSPHFIVGREKLLSRTPWLLLFGLSKDGVCFRGEIHALDTSSSRWHSIRAGILAGRYLFSVASLDGLVYVLGGCSSLSNENGNPGKSTFKTHRGVLVYNPFTDSWMKGCPMSFARAMAVTGVFEIKDGGLMKETGKSQSYGSCRCKASDSKKNGLIVVGGQGPWSQPLYTAEIYDPFSNTWREAARLPADYGIACAGVVCSGLFYVYSETDELAAYDFNCNTWISIQVSSTMPRLREYIPKLVSCMGKLILIGVAWGLQERSNGTGTDAEAVATRMLWELHPNSQTWRQFAKHPDAPLDLNAVFVCEGNQIYGIEMFKIFGQVLDFVTALDTSGSEAIWKRMSRLRLGNDLDVSSCVTKTAVLVNL